MFRTLTLVAVMSLLTACGGSAGDSTPDETPGTDPATSTTTLPAPDTSVDEPGEAEPPAGGGGSEGIPMVPAGNSTVSADGTALTPRDLLRCIPFDEGDDQLDLTVLGDSFQLFINMTGSSFNDLTIQGRAVGDGESTGVYAGSAYSSDGETWFDDEGGDSDHTTFTWTGDRVSGSMTLLDIYDSGDTVEVAFDVIVPPDTHDCSL
ncbi:MAG: hypothetical protein ACFCU2_05965 [Acidimicrobiia bacterium]